MTEPQSDQKRYVRMLLEDIWRRHNKRMRMEDHELIVLAIPTYPAQIEAVSAMDLDDIADLLAAFTKHREKTNEHELEPIGPPAGASPGSAGEALSFEQDGARAVSWPENIKWAGPEPMGQGDDGAGSSQERPEPAPEQDEGVASTDAVGEPK